jgi:hypothetical protein
VVTPRTAASSGSSSGPETGTDRTLTTYDEEVAA